MDKEIKERIAAINSGIIPEGYKKTKVGIVPWGWEVIKAKEVFSNISNKKHNGDLEVLSSTQDKGIIPRSMLDIDIKYDKESTSNYKKVEKGNFVISLRSFQGGIEYSEYEGLISPAYTVLGSKVEICDDYYKSYLKSPDYIQRLNTAVYGIRDGKNISYDDFSLIYIPFPPLPEQQKIAEILSTQDKLIELQEKKIEQLKELKKAYLQKMFPQKGSKYPELRFKGFTDPWEQRKWCDTVDISTEMVNPTEEQYSDMPHIAPGNIESFTGRVYDNVKTVKEEELISGKFRFRKGDIIYGKIRPQLGKYVFAEYDGLTSADAYVLKAHNALNQKFLFIVLQTKDFYDYSVSVSQRSGMPKINRNELNAYCFTAPNEEEQRKIGEFFLSIDRLITLHQRKSEQEKQKKKALMQLLLTGKVRCI